MPRAKAGPVAAVGGGLARLVRELSLAVAAVIALRVTLAALGANPANPIVRFLQPLADHLAGPFQQLFIPPDPTLAVAANDGLAAAAYIAGGAVAARVTLRSGEIADDCARRVCEVLRRNARARASGVVVVSARVRRGLGAGALVLVAAAVVWHVLPGPAVRRLREPFFSHRPPAESIRGPRAPAPTQVPAGSTGTWVPGNPLAPCVPVVTQGYGPTSMWGEPIVDGVRFHPGVDLACPRGTPVRSLTTGVASVSSGWDEGFGTSVVVETRTILPGGHAPATYFVRYAHLSAARVRSGERVRAGQVVGDEGTTGFSTGPHLHFEVDAGEPSVASSMNPDCLLRL